MPGLRGCEQVLVFSMAPTRTMEPRSEALAHAQVDAACREAWRRQSRVLTGQRRGRIGMQLSHPKLSFHPCPSPFASRRAPPAACTSATCARRLLNWLFARQAGGTFWLRLDDTDVQRSTEAFADGIRRDLEWLGLAWAREERQSARTARYAAAADELEARRGRLYACYETEDELDRKRKRQLARGLPPIYDRAGLKLSEAERAALEGRRAHAALALPPRQFRGRPDAAADHRLVERSYPRRPDGRRRLAVRSRRHPRRRHVPLHLHQRRRRRRVRHQPRHPRRRPRHQHRRADAAVRGAGATSRRPSATTAC